MRDFTWRDAGRTVAFRAGVLGVAEESHSLLGEHGFGSFDLLSTERALDENPGWAEAADSVHLVAPGGVPDAAAAILESAGAERLVALGGGRVIDSAKAVAAVSGAAVAALPTTMSGAEMTGIHRLPAGAEQRAAGLVRPAFVLADPLAMTTQVEPALRASSINALAHGADSLYTPYANPVSRMTALRGAELIAAALDRGPGPADSGDSQEQRRRGDRAALALGSILCGYAIDSALFGLHHVICQTLVRVCGSPHAQTNAAILPRAMAAMRRRAPGDIEALAEAIGSDAPGVERRILDLGGDPAGLGSLGAERTRLEEALDAIEARPELGFAPDPPDREELRGIIEAAW